MKRKSHRSHTKEWIEAVLFAITTIVLFRLFLFEAFTIPSPSMEKTILTGDYVVVNKYSYGARMPITPLSFPFVHQRLPFTENTKSYFDWLQLPYYRIGGPPDIKNNDIVVFNYPMQTDRPIDQRIYYIKRCVGIAGDTLEVRDGEVFVNGVHNDSTNLLQFNYRVQTDNDAIDVDSLKQLKLEQGGKMHDKAGFWFTLDREAVQRMEKFPNVTNVSPMIEKKGSYSDYVFPENDRFIWNVDQFGPLYIPKAGDSIRLSVDSLPLYERIISIYEKNDLHVINDSVYVNDTFQKYYTFKMNYYFMMGDSRHSSADSRFWGFVPEDHIVGKAEMVLLSIDKSIEESKVRRDRWMKKIN